MRDKSIELFRCTMMLFIVILHVFSYAGLGHSWLPRLCTTGVVGFVFITGYFGLRLTLRHVLRFYGIVFYCLLLCFVTAQNECGFEEACIITIQRFKGWWFVHAYAVLMMTAPLINAGISVCTNKRDLIKSTAPFLFVVFGWSFMAGMPVLSKWMPADGSLGSHTCMTLIGIYISARIFRMLNIEKVVNIRCWFCTAMIFGMLCAMNLGKYNSPVALFFIASLFIVFKFIGKFENRMLGGVVGFVNIASGSVFSVYLLHVGGGVPMIIGSWNIKQSVCQMSSFGQLFAVSIGVFFLTLSLDMPRRIINWLLSRAKR